MYCRNCGEIIDEYAKFCPKCGMGSPDIEKMKRYTSFVTSQLCPDENIEYEYMQDTKNGIILTNKRMIRYRDDWFSKKIEDIDYKHIISVSMIENNYYWLLIISIPMLIIGSNFLYSIGIWIFIIGIVLTIIATIYKERYCHIIAFNIVWKIRTYDRGLTRDIRRYIS